MLRTALRLNISGAIILLAACGDDGAFATSDDSTSSSEGSTTDDPSTTLTTAPTSADSSSSESGTTLTTADTSTTDDPTDTSSESTDPSGSESSSSTDAESSSSSGGGPVCGDGAIEGDEVCDGNDLAGEDCVSQNFDGGTLACADDCLSLNTDACINFSCGNDSIEDKEVCDGIDLGGQNCESLEFQGGTLACDENCGGYDTSGCFTCGDGVVGGTEVCDGADLDGQSCASLMFTEGTLTCAADCSAFVTDACTTCGDGIAEGNETCDGADLLGATCISEGFDGGTLACTADCGAYDEASCTTCGDNLIEGDEDCEGANLDGATCVSEGADFGTLACASDCSYDLEPCIYITDEAEPNDDGAVAVNTDDFFVPNAQGPFTDDVFIGAAINPAGDDDVFEISNPGPGYASLRLETFGPGGPGNCVLGLDTVIEIRNAMGTVLFSDDEAGINNCSLIPAYTMAPGETVYVRVIDYQDNGAIASYFLDIDLTHSVCGNGIAQLGEQCDDGGVDDGDGCSASCIAENAVQEIEPNATIAEADATGIVGDGSTLFGGAIGTVGDLDRFRVDLAAPSFIRFESFTSIDDCLSSHAMTLRVFDAANTQVVADGLGGIFSGIQSCTAITFPLPAGTFYVQVEESGNNAILPSYLLEVQSQADFGAESEPNEDIANADTNIQAAGSNVYVFADHSLNADFDFYAIDVPVDGSSLRLEIIEGDRTVETCESNGVDSRLTLYTAGGVEIANDDDEGRGWCSMIDGTGTIALDTGAHGLAAGTYYAQVRQSAAASMAGGQFIYRLVATVRTP